MSARGFFITGTDTGVGKTTVAIGLVRLLAADRAVSVMKPCETGAGDDAARLIAATGRTLSAELVNPYHFALPAAPEIAARREGAEVDLATIERAYRALSAEAALTVVEGAGGLLVPLSPSATIADLVARLNLPLLLVARTQLGTINHTLLTAEVARRRGLQVLGVVFTQLSPVAGPEEGETVAAIVRHGGLRSFGVLPWSSEADRSNPDYLAEQVRSHLAVGLLLDLIFAS